MFVFDSGYLFGILQGGSTPTPVRFGSVQSVETNIAFDLVKTPLQLQASVGMLINGLKLEFKAKSAQINGLLFDQIFFGKQLATGSELLLRDYLANVPASGPYTVAPSPGTFLQDLGVQFKVSGLPLIRVAVSPTTGQYSLSGGVYTFSASDANQAMVFNCLYSSANGNKLALANQFKGVSPSFQCVLNTSYNGKQVTWNMAKCTSKQLQMATILEKFAIPELQFEAIADLTPPYGNIGTFSFSD